jgi:predicted metal-dependent hydrolase
MTHPDFKTHFIAGVHQFNALDFWHAHESWETLWLAAETDVEQYLQGLIQMAAAYYHVRRGTVPGAVRLFDAALGRLESFPMVFCGIDRTAVDAAARRHREWVESVLQREDLGARLADTDFPRLAFASGEGGVAPPTESW